MYDDATTETQMCPTRRERTGLYALVGCGVLMVTLVCVATKVGAKYDETWDAAPLLRLRHCRKDRVLVTGFQKFSEVENPSQMAAMALNGTCGQRYCVESVISVDDDGAGWAAARVQDYAAVLHLGLEDHAKGLRVETAAKNLIGSRQNPPSFETPCDDQHVAVPGAPCLQVTTAPLDRMLLEPRAYSVEEIWSRDPGAFFCNECYFRTLNAVRSQKLTIPAPDCLPPRVRVAPALIPVLFVHLPDPDLLSFDDIVLPLLRQLLNVLGDPPLRGDLVPTPDVADLG